MHTRRTLLTAALALPALGCPRLPGVAGLPGVQGVLEAARPGYQVGSKVHAFQSWSLIYSFARGNATGLRQAIARIQAHGVPLLEALVQAGTTPTLVAEPFDAGQGITAYAIHLDVKKGKQTTRIPGRQGTAEAAWRGAIDRVAKATGVPAQQVQDGHGAWYGLTQALTGLDAEAATLGKHAFALKVLQEQVQAGEPADWFDATRPAPETLADTDTALGLIADDIDRVRGEQAALLALLALANHAAQPGVLDAVREELAAADADAAEWLATHHPPTPADFGVVWQAPDPMAIRAALEEQLGMVGSAVQLARGLATGDLPRTLDGLAGLAPKDTKLKTVAEGLAAASKGDIKGTLGALADLGGPDTRVGRIAGRLETVAGALDLLP